MEIAGYGRTTYQSFDDRVAEAACAYLAEKAQTRDRPFAAVAGFVLPHCPFFAPKDLYDYYYDRVDVPQPDPTGEPAAVTNFKKRRLIDEPLPAERIRVARAAYFGLCEYFDRKVGQLLDQLDADRLARQYLGDLLQRPRRNGRRARLLVEEQLLRRLGRRPPHRPFARRDTSGRGEPSAVQFARLGTHRRRSGRRRASARSRRPFPVARTTGPRR